MPATLSHPTTPDASERNLPIAERLARVGKKSPLSGKLKPMSQAERAQVNLPINPENLKKVVKIQKNLDAAALGLTKGKRSTVALTAQQYADLEARKHAAVAGEMIRNCVCDMQNILNELRTKIDFAEPSELKAVTDTYAAATRELRRALGLLEEQQGTLPTALVQVQCLGSVQVANGEIESGEEAIEMPDVHALEQ